MRTTEYEEYLRVMERRYPKSEASHDDIDMLRKTEEATEDRAKTYGALRDMIDRMKEQRRFDETSC